MRKLTDLCVRCTVLNGMRVHCPYSIAKTNSSEDDMETNVRCLVLSFMFVVRAGGWDALQETLVPSRVGADIHISERERCWPHVDPQVLRYVKGSQSAKRSW